MNIVENGRTLDATFHLEAGPSELMLVFESRNGARGSPGARNTEYDLGLEILLTRLKAAGIHIKALRLDPRNGEPGSHLELGALGPPVLLERIDDMREVRLAITRAAAQTHRQPGARGSGNPSKRLRMYLLGGDSSADDVRALERRLAGLDSRCYWALFADPGVYRIDDAVAELDTDNWTTRGKDIHAGDRVLIWRGAGGGRFARGVVAFGDVLTEPRDMDDLANPYWIDRTQAGTRGPRAVVRYVRPHGLPLLAAGPHEAALQELAIARARGGTVFAVDPSDWERVVAAAGGWPEPQAADGALEADADAEREPREHAPPGRGRGQGIGLTPSERKAVEQRAMAVAREHYESAGWTVRDMSNANCYDLWCIRGGDELRVEVKGTTGGGATVRLTRNEVRHARERYPNVALVVVSGIELTRGDAPAASRGAATIHHPWAIDEDALSPLAFEYVVPQARR